VGKNSVNSIDRKILECLQEDAAMAVADIAEKVGLSKTPCWRRIRQLEQNGVIRRRVALLDREKLNLGVTVFVGVKTSKHDIKWLDTFAKAVVNFPEVVEFYRMSGDIDYMLRVVVPDIAAYDAFYQRMIQRIDLTDVSSSFAMEEIKYTTALPLDYAD
jgi:Lrp/AsnC family transcriptional regulator